MQTAMCMPASRPRVTHVVLQVRFDGARVAPDLLIITVEQQPNTALPITAARQQVVDNALVQSKVSKERKPRARRAKRECQGRDECQG